MTDNDQRKVFQIFPFMQSTQLGKDRKHTEFIMQDREGKFDLACEFGEDGYFYFQTPQKSVTELLDAWDITNTLTIVTLN